MADVNASAGSHIAILEALRSTDLSVVWYLHEKGAKINVVATGTNLGPK